MSQDYKDDVQAIFDELCQERCGVDYWHLPDDVQYALYREAERMYIDQMCDQADYLRNREREGV